MKGLIRTSLFVVFGLLSAPMMCSASPVIAWTGVAMFIAAIACGVSLSWEQQTEERK